MVLYAGDLLTMKVCKNRNCNNIVEGRKHYCRPHCQYWERQMIKDDESGMMPKKKRTRHWFWAYAGSSFGKGQGKRVGHMVTGGLTGIPVANFNIKEVTEDNLNIHFNNPTVGVAILGDGSRITKELYEQQGLACI